jgi:hypothetical protein
MYENGKLRPVETIPGIREGGIKENDRGRQIQLCYVVRTFVNVTMYPQYNDNKIKNVFLHFLM